MKLSNKGQGMVEYILLIAVLMAIMTSVFRQIEAYLISNPNSLQNSFIGGFKNGVSGDYKRFQIYR